MGAIASYYFTEFRLYLNEEYSRAPLWQLLQGTAERPFQYRALVPWMVAALTSGGIPIPAFHLPPQLWLVRDLTLQQARAFVLIDLAAVFFLFLAFRSYLCLLTGRRTQSDIMAFAVFATLPFNYLIPRNNPLWFPYDIVAILVFTLGLITLYKEKWAWFYLVFVIGTLNRETTCFLSVLFVVTQFGKMRTTRLFIHGTLQFCAWIGIKAILSAMYRGNAGDGVFEVHISENIAYLLTPQRYPFLLSSLGFTLVPVIIFYNKIPSLFVRRSLLMAPLFVSGMFVVGNIWELRIYGELLPVILPAFLLIVRQLLVEDAPMPLQVKV